MVDEMEKEIRKGVAQGQLDYRKWNTVAITHLLTVIDGLRAELSICDCVIKRLKGMEKMERVVEAAKKYREMSRQATITKDHLKGRVRGNFYIAEGVLDQALKDLEVE